MGQDVPYGTGTEPLWRGLLATTLDPRKEEMSAECSKNSECSPKHSGNDWFLFRDMAGNGLTPAS